jgi:eukaryotic-like serine/threonine-protein kinase
MKPTTTDEEEIFHQAMEIRDTAQREAYLRRSCQSDPLLRQSVDAMLIDHDQATRLFQEVASGFKLDEDALAHSTDELGVDPDLGTAIGPYRIVQRLGEGGGGIVYEAEQDAPVHRKVALKILKPGIDKWRVMNRFQAERQALELMEHPNIARVLDAGVTRDGRQYFVMELVRGTKITEHCLKHSVPLAARLQLLQQVCSAVEHAHQKGIIHCDLKPSNILITLVEGVPLPKVIDFGIAKATASAPSEWTRQGFPAGTPAYMSPEQISGSKDIDTRSDIYSLGVIMYELIAGHPPFDKEESSKSGAGGLRPRLLEQDPPTPTQRALRNGNPRVEWNEDLDWIVMTALERDRERRYATVRGLGQDIARYLAHEPILARPPSRLYRLRKLVRRNRLASGAIAASVLALMAGFTASSYLYVKADAAERKQAELRVAAEAAEQKQAQLRAEAEERAYVTKAAILLMQNKTAEADAEIQRMGGMLTQPSVEATNVFHKLGTWNALRGDWKAASQRLLALSRVNRFDDSDMTDNATRDLVPIAPTLVEAENLEALGQFEVFLTDRLGNTNNPVAAEQVLKICLQYPPSPNMLTRLEHVAAVAEKSLPATSPARLNWLQAWRCFAVGLWDYRVGHYGESVRFLNLAMTAPRNEPVVNACCLALRSMALRSLGRTANADADLAEAKGLIERKFSSPLEMDNEGLWHDWLTARILLREATPK